MADTVEGLVKRDIYEVANQLQGFVGPGTPDDLAAFLVREGTEAGNLADEIVRLRAQVEALVVERDALAHDLRLVQERKDDIEAQRDKLRAGLEYAAMGIGRIHDSLLSNGPKQASGEMTAHFRDRARSTLNEIAP